MNAELHLDMLRALGEGEKKQQLPRPANHHARKLVPERPAAAPMLR
jgi:hypothetical protein